MPETVEPVGSIGVVADVEPEKLPAAAWSDARNARFDGYTARLFLGERKLFDPPTVAPYALFHVTTSDGVAHFVYAGLAKVYILDGDTHTDITRSSGDYNALASLGWTGGVLNGLLILNNGVDLPQAHAPSTVATLLQDLPNWPTSSTCAVMRPFKNFLVALDVTKSSVRDRQMVKWSHPADPGSVPASWDETDPTLDAGETSLAETNGAVIDCLPLRDINIVYKTDSVWGMQHTGGPFVFRFYNLFPNTGILTKRCVVAFEGFHAFVSSDFDVFIHDGQTLKSIAQDKWRTWLRDNIDSAYFDRVFLTTNPAEKELWVCITESGGTPNSKALVWNWKHDTWSVRDLPGVTDGRLGVVVSSAATPLWSAVIGSWADQGVSTWALVGAVPPSEQLLLAGPVVGIIEVDTGSLDANGAAVQFMLQRTGLWAFAGATDLQSVKFIRRVRFRTKTGGNPTTLTARVSVTMDIDEDPDWVSVNFTSGTSAELSVFRRGRFLGVEISGSGGTPELHAVEVDAQIAGRY